LKLIRKARPIARSRSSFQKYFDGLSVRERHSSGSSSRRAGEIGVV